MTRQEKVSPEVSGFRLRPKTRGVGSGRADTKTEGIQKSARGPSPLLLADLACWEHREPEMHPKTSLRKDKSTALMATHSPTTPRKGGTQGKEGQG
jgi:hypothetical protein